MLAAYEDLGTFGNSIFNMSFNLLYGFSVNERSLRPETEGSPYCQSDTDGGHTYPCLSHCQPMKKYNTGSETIRDTLKEIKPSICQPSQQAYRRTHHTLRTGHKTYLRRHMSDQIV